MKINTDARLPQNESLQSLKQRMYDIHREVATLINATSDTAAAALPLTGGTLTGPLIAPAGASGTQVAQIQEARPPSEIAYFARSTAPAGWLKANGALVSRTTYAALFAATGTMFGAGDGSTTFALPDLRGEFIRGFDDARGVDVARVIGSAQGHQFQDHQHTTAYNDAITAPSNGVVRTQAAADDATTISRSASSGSRGAETRPRNIALLACIKY